MSVLLEDYFSDRLKSIQEHEEKEDLAALSYLKKSEVSPNGNVLA